MNTKDFKIKVIDFLNRELEYHIIEAQKDRSIPCINDALIEEGIIRELNHLISHVKSFKTED